jgi:hypothetical protein
MARRQRPGGLRARRSWGGHRVCAPGVGAPVPCGQVLLKVGCSPVRVTGQDGCRVKGHFALFGVPSGGVAVGQSGARPANLCSVSGRR